MPVTIFHVMRGNFKRQAIGWAVPRGDWCLRPCVELRLPEPKNVYDRRHACAIALAMRYVIVIAAIAFFLIWDGLYNQGRYLDISVRELSHIVRYVTGKA